MLKEKDDTDFSVDLLYDFAHEIGATVIKANYHRWYVDLNRNKEDKNLYEDGRLTTSLFPTTDFFGSQIYKNSDFSLSALQRTDRIQSIYDPYYGKINHILNGFKKEFGTAILWDAHSIKRNVPTISQEPFKDFILGTNEHQSADTELIDFIVRRLKVSGYTFSINEPFKGGNITRHFGDPDRQIHAFQLEMSKDLYLKEGNKFCPEKSQPIIAFLKDLIEQLSLQIHKS